MKHLKSMYLSAMAFVAAVISAPVMAQTAANPIVTMLESVDMTAVAAAVGVIALLIIAIALTFKGPDVAKRVIRKV